MIEPKEIKYLDKELMKRMCHKLACDLFNTTNDPIAKFEEHEHDLLDLSLQAPRQTFGGNDLYPTLIDKAVAIYYALNKNHPFKNGNKRLAQTSLLVFLYINDHWLDVDGDALYRKTLEIAQSDAKERERIIGETKIWVKENTLMLEEVMRKFA